MKDKRKWRQKYLNFETSAIRKKTEILRLDNIGKYLKLNKKLIRFMIIKILLAILPFISNYYFN